TMETQLRSNTRLSVLEMSPILVPYFLGFFMYQGLFSNFPLYIQITKNLSDVETVRIWAIISGTALLIGALSRIPAGLISDRIGRFRAFLLAYLSYFVSLLLVLSYSTDIIYILAMALIRVGTNFVAMTGRGIVSVTLRDKGLKNGLLQSMAGFGSFLGPIILGYILDTYQPTTILYASLVVVTFDLIIFLLMFRIIPAMMVSRNLQTDVSYDPVLVTGASPKEYLSVLKFSGVLDVQILFLATGFSIGLLLSVYSIYGYNILGISTTVLGFITGTGSLAATLASPIAGKLQASVKDEYLRTGAWALMFVSTILVTLSPIVPFFFYIALIVMNAGLASYYVVDITRISSLVPQDKFSFTFGLASTLVILASAIAGYISPFLYRILPEMNFYVSASITFLALLLSLKTAIQRE
ncbi:MAG: MFS transporter, partial [Candidatus Kariarchaeaceae archaeon]